MVEATAAEVAKRFARYRQAAQQEPVTVTHHGRITEMLISKRDYDDYLRLKGLVTRALWVSELSDEIVTGLAEARVDPHHDHLDALVDD